ncbi:SDR family NAD(P)-dependent oxidoreductase, partial [Chloroflexota bacterium]
LEGRSVIVTGGGSNIGKGIVLAFAKEGSKVVIAEIDQDRAEKVAEEACSIGAKSIAVLRADVTNPDHVKAMVSYTIDKFGTIDVLVNNVGAGSNQPFSERSRENISQELDINLWSVINCIRAVLTHMVNRETGSIVNIVSHAGRQGYAGLNIYSTAKAGIIGLTQALAREVGPHGIRLNCVAPGRIPPSASDNRPERGSAANLESALRDIEKRACIKRLGSPADITNATVFLASSASGYITGQTLSVCGGLTFH